MICQIKNCGELASHGAILDDRWYEEAQPGPNFKPMELLLGCEEHIWELVSRSVVTFNLRREHLVITKGVADRWRELLLAGQVVPAKQRMTFYGGGKPCPAALR